jgi:hypothetical protein
MSTTVMRGRTESSGGGETQSATPRILAAELGQRQRRDPAKEERGEERRELEEAGGIGHMELRGDGGALFSDERGGTDTSELAE